MINRKKGIFMDKVIEVVPFVLAVAISVGGFVFTQYQKKFDKSSNGVHDK